MLVLVRKNTMTTAHLSVNVWPAATHIPQEPETFFKPCLRFSVKSLILDKAMLEIDRSDYNHTMTYCRIRNLKSFSADELNEMKNPTRMKCQLLE
jgi:hypothetical protein